jgi:hypothetical protein
MAAARAPLVPLARLYEKVSTAGNRYFTGRLGYGRVLLFADGEADDGTPTWRMYVQEVEEVATRPQDGRQAVRPANGASRPSRPSTTPTRPPSDLSDELPQALR